MQTPQWTGSMEHIFPILLDFSFVLKTYSLYSWCWASWHQFSRRTQLLSFTGFVKKWQCMSKVCLVSSQDQALVIAVLDLLQLNKLLLNSWSAVKDSESQAQCNCKPSYWLVINIFSCCQCRKLTNGSMIRKLMLTWREAAWSGCNTISGNLLTRKDSLCKNSCLLGGVRLLATALGGQHAHFARYGKGLNQMFGCLYQNQG